MFAGFPPVKLGRGDKLFHLGTANARLSLLTKQRNYALGSSLLSPGKLMGERKERGSEVPASHCHIPLQPHGFAPRHRRLVCLVVFFNCFSLNYFFYYLSVWFHWPGRLLAASKQKTMRHDVHFAPSARFNSPAGRTPPSPWRPHANLSARQLLFGEQRRCNAGGSRLCGNADAAANLLPA